MSTYRVVVNYQIEMYAGNVQADNKEVAMGKAVLMLEQRFMPTARIGAGIFPLKQVALRVIPDDDEREGVAVDG